MDQYQILGCFDRYDSIIYPTHNSGHCELNVNIDENNINSKYNLSQILLMALLIFLQQSNKKRY